MWTCKKCGEPIEDQFDSCWKCTGSAESAGSSLSRSQYRHFTQLALFLTSGFLVLNLIAVVCLPYWFWIQGHSAGILISKPVDGWLIPAVAGVTIPLFIVQFPFLIFMRGIWGVVVVSFASGFFYAWLILRTRSSREKGKAFGV